MKKILKISIVILFSLTSAFAGQQGSFPIGPNLSETPGKLCDKATAHRYPENIKYCERNVDSYTKKTIIQRYDTLFGYTIESMNRIDFKIDHLIPLCAGGGNDMENLWPQHKSIYQITDPLEPLICQKMLEGKLLQADAVKLIIQAKSNLNQVPAIMQKVNNL